MGVLMQMEVPGFLFAILENEKSLPLRQVLGMFPDSSKLQEAIAEALANLGH